ncbi:methyltransferase-domain-containing protein [Chlamydoabsidia padenii]|nr:methyltransferase-domain-containing protein [Chlamydoabsidia padenii]
MQPLFQTSGWSLPANIAADTKKKQNKGDDSTSTKVTKDADQLQAQFNQLGPKKDKKNKKKRDRQKSDTNTQAPMKKAKTDQEGGTITQQEQQLQQKQQSTQKKQDRGSHSKDSIIKTNKGQPSKQQQPTTDTKQQQQPDSASNNNTKTKQSLPVKNTPSANKTKKPLDANKKNKLKELLNKSKASTAVPIKAPSESKPVAAPPQPTTTKNKSNTTEPGLTALQLKMKDKLSGARFRWLNEKLYTTEGNEAFSLFQEKPELFDEYHEGFRHQVESWPVNPVDLILEQLSKMPKGTVVADLGCGDAVIGHTLKKQKVLSYDLIAKNDKVIACDITKLPLSANVVDVVVFSLSLMGTNYVDFLKEAHRILKEGGEMKIAEVVSRFSDIDGFIDLVESLGFDFMEKDDDNKMFVMLYFTKRPESDMMADADDDEMLEGLSKSMKRSLKQGAGVRTNMNKLRKKSQILLKPCLYKRR